MKYKHLKHKKKIYQSKFMPKESIIPLDPCVQMRLKNSRNEFTHNISDTDVKEIQIKCVQTSGLSILRYEQKKIKGGKIIKLYNKKSED